MFQVGSTRHLDDWLLVPCEQIDWVYVNWEDKYGGALWIRQLNSMTRSWFSHLLFSLTQLKEFIISSIRVLISADSKIRASLLWWSWREFKRVMLQFVQNRTTVVKVWHDKCFCKHMKDIIWQIKVNSTNNTNALRNFRRDMINMLRPR